MLTTGAWHQAETLSNRVTHNGNTSLEDKTLNIVVSWRAISDGRETPASARSQAVQLKELFITGLIDVFDSNVRGAPR